jgi:tetratricopeptide (TPR) repeat protein
MRGKVEMALGQDVQAERDLSAAFDTAPEQENFALDLGLFYIRKWKYQEALRVFRKANGFRKHDPYLQLGLALSQFLAGESLESVETCRALLALQPDFSPVRLMMAFGLYMGGKIDEAEKIAAQGLHDPNPPCYLYYLHAVALLKLQSKDYNVILDDLNRAVRGIPGCSLCYLALSKVHQRTGDQESALSDLEKAISLDPSFSEAWYRLAALCDQTGRHTEGQQARRRFEELKEDKANRETDILRNVFLNVMGGESSSQGNP